MITLNVDQARRLLLRATGLLEPQPQPGLAGALATLDALGCVQIDPLDRVGANADLVLHARVDGLVRGDWARTMPRHAFEHFAKERCLLPARLFPAYRDRAAQAPWWRLESRLGRLPEGILAEVVEELRATGPAAASALSDRGRVDPMDWSGWKGTARANAMALEVLWTRCEVVTAGRTPGGERLYDVPERSLPDWHDRSQADADPLLVAERVRGAGLLSTAGGPQWSMLSTVRTSGLVERMVERGQLAMVLVAGSRRTYLCLPSALEQALAAKDDDTDARMRVLGPLDPLLWDRKLVAQVFDFDYIWEVYKPEAERRWGYYVTPLLHHGRLVGRVEARRVRADDGAFRVQIDRIWTEQGPLDQAAFDEAIDRLRVFQGA